MVVGVFRILFFWLLRDHGPDTRGAGASECRRTVRTMSSDISMQSTTTGGPRQPSHYLPGPRPDDLPISAAVWDVAKSYGKQSEAVVIALYEAVKKLEANQMT